MHNLQPNYFGQVQPTAFLQQSIVTPAEKIAQYTLIGASGGALLAALAMYAFDTVPRQKRAHVATLIAVPAVGAIAGAMIVKREYQL